MVMNCDEKNGDECNAAINKSHVWAIRVHLNNNNNGFSNNKYKLSVKLQKAL